MPVVLRRHIRISPGRAIWKTVMLARVKRAFPEAIFWFTRSDILKAAYHQNKPSYLYKDIKKQREHFLNAILLSDKIQILTRTI